MLTSTLLFATLTMAGVHAYAAPAPISSQETPLELTGTWPDAWVAGAGWNVGWKGGEGPYTFSGILTYPDPSDVGKNVTNATVIAEDWPLHNYIYHFGTIDTYPSDATFKFQINDTASAYAESPELGFVTPAQATADDDS
ncbi:hypothetical protein IAU60_003639 [Kwoniella sp. DSM 27419]